ncbi:hypothetical protein DL93DRAFT_2228404 [Clavulina sp. PMI_390]|nr:hypothetical protein DL93DRAFT_2228404 [Clavulina sp. PMI_390]
MTTINKLPNEVVASIFHHCTLYDPDLFPMHYGVSQERRRIIWDNICSLLHVCKPWNRIVMSTPRIWEFVMFKWTPENNYAEPLKIFLARSKNAPLYLYVEMVYDIWDAQTEAITTLLPHMHRVRSLRFIGPPSLQKLLLPAGQALPALRECYVQVGSSIFFFPPQSGLDTEAPDAIEDDAPSYRPPVVLTSFHASGSWMNPLLVRIDVRSLRELTLVGNWVTPEATHCLTQFTSLETLEITTCCLRVPEAMTLPTLRTLLIRGKSRDLGIFFASLPSLEHLSVLEGGFLVPWDRSADSQFLRELNLPMHSQRVVLSIPPPPPSLPNLLSLTINSDVSGDALSILRSSPMVKRLHLGGSADFAPILRFLSPYDNTSATLVPLNPQHHYHHHNVFPNIDLLRIWPLPRQIATVHDIRDLNRQEAHEVARLLDRLLATRPALHAEIGVVGGRWNRESFRELETKYGDDRVDLWDEGDNENNWNEIRQLGYIPLPQTFRSPEAEFAAFHRPIDEVYSDEDEEEEDEEEGEDGSDSDDGA